MKASMIILSVLTIITTASSQDRGWKKITIPEKAGSKYAFVDFSDSLHGLLCTADAYLTFTSNGGQSWTPVQKAATTGTVFKAKMADTGTALLAVNPAQGNTKVYKITQAGTMKDSLLLPAFLDQSKYYGRGTISILNPHLIGFVTPDTSQYFIFTKNFGSSWDTVAFDRAFRSAKLLAVEALDSLRFFIGASAAGVGLGSGGHLYQSDDGMKTLQEIPTTAFETIGMKFFTREFACFGMTHSSDMTASQSSLLLYNTVTKQSGSFTGDRPALLVAMGALFRDGGNFSIPTNSHVSYQGNGIYQISRSTVAGDSLKFSALAIGAKKSYWYLTEEGRLFTNADNPAFSQVYFPLETGNLWQYYSNDVFHPEMRQSKIIGDTLMPNAKRYAVMQGSNLGTSFLRQEGSKVYGYDWTDSSEYVLFDFAANTNDTLSRHGKGKWTNVAAGRLTYQGAAIDQWRFYQRMNTGLSGYIFYDWVIHDSLGLSSWVEEPGAGYRLSGAIINGKTTGTITSVREDRGDIPLEFGLAQNYPNPFNPSTTISFDVPKASRLRIVVYDLLGREVSVLADGVYPAGRHQAVFHGAAYASGIYIYRLTGEGFSSVKKMLLAK